MYVHHSLLHTKLSTDIYRFSVSFQNSCSCSCLRANLWGERWRRVLTAVLSARSLQRKCRQSLSVTIVFGASYNFPSLSPLVQKSVTNTVNISCQLLQLKPQIFSSPPPPLPNRQKLLICIEVLSNCVAEQETHKFQCCKIIRLSFYI